MLRIQQTLISRRMSRWLVILGVAIACSTSRTEVGVDTDRGISVSVRTDRASVDPGQRLSITVTVSNGSADSRTLDFSTSCKTTFEFLDLEGRTVGVGTPMCLQVLTSKTLAPGETFAENHEWSRSPLELPQLAPGRYQIRGVLLARDGQRRSAAAPVTIP
jgi:hypothetical protein